MMAPSDEPDRPVLRVGGSGWRALGLFWVCVLLILGGGAAILQKLGPPAPSAGRTVPLAVAASSAQDIVPSGTVQSETVPLATVPLATAPSAVKPAAQIPVPQFRSHRFRYRR